MIRSLRGRILAALALLTLLGLAVTDVATVFATHSFLVQRTDDQLDRVEPQIHHIVVQQLYGRGPGRGPTAPNPRDLARELFGLLPSGGYLAVISPDGRPLLDVAAVPPGQGRTAPRLPSKLEGPPPGERQVLTEPSVQAGGPRFRLHVESLQSGDLLVLGQSLREVDATVTMLAAIVGLVSAAVLAAVFGTGFWLVRAGLRPLERIAATADAIAGGDLSLRAPPGDPRTEVGRLAAAFNAMLTGIERAFAEQQASEQRLRRFIADASHELRTPLTSVRGYAELFRRGAHRRPEDLAKVLSRIEHEARRMGVLVDDLLLLARLDQGRPLEREQVDVRELAREAVEAARAVEPERPLTLDAPNQVLVAGDRLRLRQVLDNLLANVRVHTPGGAPAQVAVRVDQGAALLEVTDSGPGVPAEVGAGVFERFYRLDPGRSRDQGGSGLGLSIVAAIAAAHGGSAGLRSAPGHGATFAVSLPLATPGAAAEAAAPAAAPEPARR